jgi:hypothetical protein
MDESTDEPEFLFHSAGQFARKPIRHSVQAGRLEQLASTPLSIIAKHAEHIGVETDVY